MNEDMNEAARYAIYFVPQAETALARFGARMIGYDVWSGAAVPLANVQAYGASGPALTAEPRRYGFHATLKAPFRLRDGARLQDLATRAAAFAASRAPLALGPLVVHALSRFIALVPAHAPSALATLAADCVTHFDDLRAPLPEADRVRRLAAGLTARQTHYLDAWGYPFVLDEFRFHLTLSGPVAPAMRAELLSELAALWAQCEAPAVIDGLTLAVQPSRNAQFRAAAHFPFRAAPAAEGNR